jgi:uncharacterized protein DUF6968
MPAIADTIAERQLACIKPNGDRVLVTLRLGKPYRASDVDWACPVALDGLERKLPDIHGVHSFQALMLAQKLLLQLMTGVVEDGGRFEDDEDGSPIDVTKLFAAGI